MEQIIEGTPHISAAEAAAQLKTTLPRVLMLLKSGALSGCQVDGEWFVSLPSLACAQAHGTDQHVARGCRTYCSSSGCGCK